MSFVDCTNIDLQGDDLLRSVFSYNTVTEEVMLNICIIPGKTSFFTCLSKGMDLADALRQTVVQIGDNICVNVNTM